MKYKKYDTSLRSVERKHQKQKKELSSENMELMKLQRSWNSGKERVRLAKLKAKSSTSQSIKNRVKLTIEKQEHLSELYAKQKTKVSRLKGSVRSLALEIKNLKSEKNQYEKAMEKYEKQWLQFYSKNINNSRKKVSTIDKVDFGIQIRAARALLNLSTSEFATLIDVPLALLKRIEQPSDKLSLEPQLVKSIHTILKRAGVELIEEGLYVSTGGVGVRMIQKPSRARSLKPKDKRPIKTSTKASTVKKKTKSTMKKVA